MSKLQRSGQDRPCPVCHRTKDADCRISEDGNLVLCHSEVNGRAQGEELKGFIYVKPTDDHLWGEWVRKEENWVKPVREHQECHWDYCDRDGNPLVRVHRRDTSEGKKIWQTCLLPEEEKPRPSELLPLAVPYRYQECVDAQGRGKTVFWVEGEPCADALWNLGIPSTTTIRGCGAYRSEQYKGLFAQELLVICPDRDCPGLDYAQAIAQDYPQAQFLYADPGHREWVKLPASGGFDVADWIDLFKRQGLKPEEIKSTILGAIEPQRDNLPQTKAASSFEKGKIKEKEPPIFELLMDISRECELWHSDDQTPYADIVMDGIRKTYPVRSKWFKNWLAAELYKRHGKGSNSEAMQSCLNVLEAQAAFDGVERSIFLRTGEDDQGNVYIDLANDVWEVIKVSRSGWEVIPSHECPIRFRRNNAQLPIAKPLHGGNFERIWEFIKVNDDFKPLLVAWVLSCLVPSGHKPIVVLTGSKGSGKTTIGEVFRTLLDPTKAGLLPTVGDARNLAVAATNRWLFVYDNLSSLSIEQQDHLCRASTGAGFSHRTLHTDLEETFVEYTRPQVLTSVDFIPTKSDLLDRSILIPANRLSEAERISKTELDALLEQAAPEILGGFLDLLVLGLSRLDSVTEPLPRMTDYAKLGMAAGIPGFIEQYRQNITNAEDAAIEASPVAAAIVELVTTNGKWQGTASNLVVAIKELSEEQPVKKLTARTLGKKLSGHLKADLEAVGIECDSCRTKKERIWIFNDRKLPASQTENLTSPTSPTSPNPQNPSKINTFGGDMKVTSGDMKPSNVTQTSPNVTPNVTAKTQAQKDFQGTGDISDVGDIKNYAYLVGDEQGNAEQSSCVDNLNNGTSYGFCDYHQDVDPRDV